MSLLVLMWSITVLMCITMLTLHVLTCADVAYHHADVLYHCADVVYHCADVVYHCADVACPCADIACLCADVVFATRPPSSPPAVTSR
jgi:hypothetical protein